MRLESHAEPGPRRRAAAALLAALRPAQWTKNAVVLAPLVFALRATDRASAARALLATALFCLLASAAYLGNDVADRERDRRHPRKRHRPVAAGELTVRAALAAALVLAASGLAAAAALGPGVLACAAGYAGLQVLYSRTLKHLPLLDVFAIAGGFVLRAVAGAEAIDVPVSGWLYLCTLLLALFLALEKRRAELALLDDGAAEHRAALGAYSPALLDQLVTVVAACTILAYALYTVAPDTVAKFGSDRLKYTLPFVLFGIFRYLYLVARQGRGGEPERVLLGDPQLRAVVLGWGVVVAWALYLR
ncbi:MAG TPA: decaprenyl-phosphate phosphoribosyltransferase [Anaeromyxobacteraceae bacterium]|nr:decaprenyl-phosphate phosphoribosyltransferase [Anaeromyxobacteraceae bacterium]